MRPEEATRIVRRLCKEAGFDACGISTARFLEEEALPLERWLKQGYHGEMQWMERHFDARLDPRKLVPGAKSVVSVLLNYYPSEKQDEGAAKISKYAYGRDYHKVVKKKLLGVLKGLTTEVGEVEARAFVDSAPVMERAWAKRSGLGWIGKHSLLLNRNGGSYFFLGELILDLELVPDGPTTDHCGTCTACLDHCPTQAIVSPGVVDSNKCISYLTIEYKKALPERYQNQLDGWVYGCDVCQDVCPWNRFAKPHSEPDFTLRPELKSRSSEAWEEVTQELWEEIFRGSPVRRAGYEAFKRSAGYVSKAKNPQRRRAPGGERPEE